MEVTLSWPVEANSEVRGRVRAAHKVLECTSDTQTDRGTQSVHYMILVVTIIDI